MLASRSKGKITRKRKTITKAEKYAVWNKYIGADQTEGKCYCCKQVTIHIMNFQVGHNKAHALGGADDISNYRPICSLCNSSMRTQSIESYKKKLNPELKKKTKAIKSSTKLEQLHKSKSRKNLTKHRGNDLAILEVKARKHLSALGYIFLSKKHGFDICAKKSAFLETDKYLAVKLNHESEVSASYILNFLKKIPDFYDLIKSQMLFGSPDLSGLICHTGDLSEEVAALVKGNDTPIFFKKF
jgi:hypothetical protein